MDQSIKVNTNVLILSLLLSQLYTELLSVAWDNEIPRRCINNAEIVELLNNLEDGDQFIVTTDKTNGFGSVSTNQICDYGE